jgi:hypothetical protein
MVIFLPELETKVVNNEEKLMRYIKTGGYGFFKNTYLCKCNKYRNLYLLTYLFQFDKYVIVCPECYKKKNRYSKLIIKNLKS